MGRILPAANSITNTGTVTVLDSNFTLQDNVDPTKQAQFQLSGISSAATRTYTLPNGTGIIPLVGGTGMGTAQRVVICSGNNGVQISAGLALDASDNISGFSKTVTAGGTTGAQTINKMTGSVNFAAAAQTLVVTNSLVTTSSLIIATVMTDDTTAKSVAVSALSAGSFTLKLNAAATAETKVAFFVIN